MSFIEYPMVKAVSKGIIELWHPESAIMEMVLDLSSEVGTLFPRLACSDGNGMSVAITVGCGFDGLFTHLPR